MPYAVCGGSQIDVHCQFGRFGEWGWPLATTSVAVGGGGCGDKVAQCGVCRVLWRQLPETPLWEFSAGPTPRAQNLPELWTCRPVLASSLARTRSVSAMEKTPQPASPEGEGTIVQETTETPLKTPKRRKMPGLLHTIRITDANHWVASPTERDPHKLERVSSMSTLTGNESTSVTVR